MACDVIEATRQMLSSRERLEETVPLQPFQTAAEDSCRYLLLVLDELQKQTSEDLSVTSDQMRSDGVTDYLIMHHTDPLSFLGMYFGDAGMTLTFVQTFTEMTLRQQPVSVRQVTHLSHVSYRCDSTCF